MKIVFYSMLTAVIAVNMTLAGCAKNASERRAASPTMSERISKDSVKGRVNEIGAKYVSIRDNDGESRRHGRWLCIHDSTGRRLKVLRDCAG